jgi:hypothetical protein
MAKRATTAATIIALVFLVMKLEAILLPILCLIALATLLPAHQRGLQSPCGTHHRYPAPPARLAAGGVEALFSRPHSDSRPWSYSGHCFAGEMRLGLGQLE